MVALYQVSPGQEVVADDVNQLVKIMGGVAGVSQPITFKHDSTTDYVLTVQPQDATNGRALKILDASNTSLLQVDKNGAQTSRLAVGTTAAPAGNQMLVDLSNTATSGQMASFEYANTGGNDGDVSSVRIVAWETGTANNQTRPLEVHMMRTSGTGEHETHGVDVSIQGNASNALAPGLSYNGVRVRSLGTTWAISGAVRQDNGVFVGYDENGFKYGFRYVGTAAEGLPELFRVDQNGVMEGRHHYPTADNSYDLGNASGPVIWRSVYAHNHIIGNGSAAAPSICFLNDLSTGFYRSAADTLAYSINGGKNLEITSTGLFNFTNGQQVAVGAGGAATLGQIVAGWASTAQSVWLKYQFNGVTYAVPGWAAA